MTESSSFDLVAFVPLLRERIYTKNTFARQFVVSWVSWMNMVVCEWMWVGEIVCVCVCVCEIMGVCMFVGVYMGEIVCVCVCGCVCVCMHACVCV